ncbi:hypothetical protein ACFOU0_06540 [Salinicoccus sesuvii]|uniref:Uncharacterized protein n=1 Tax=Salinicoccus sesuvii TaxID=868281 RepID=A0ABV7N5U3_9STAP
MKEELLKYTEGRNAPLPVGSWTMYQRWEDLMCIHIPIEPEMI